jgi:hypothetical protein
VNRQLFAVEKDLFDMEENLEIEQAIADLQLSVYMLSTAFQTM